MSISYEEKNRQTWEEFISIETNSESDIDELMKFFSENPSMTNPMMTATGREEVRNFLLADISWSKPVYYWELFEGNRLAIEWSQYPLANTKSEPELLHSCATWTLMRMDCWTTTTVLGAKSNAMKFYLMQVLN